MLLNQLKPAECSLAPLQTRDLRTRAEQVILTYTLNGANLLTSIRYFKTPMPLGAANTLHRPH